MKYNAQQVELLAAEYVLGTLSGAARRRFDRLIADRADVRFEVWRWERHLNGMATGLESRTPPRRVWENIRRRIAGPQLAKPTFFERWRGLMLALPTAAAAAWLAILLWPAPAAERIAVFADQNADTLWVISADLDEAVIKAEGRNIPALATDSSYELWILRDDNPPLSLGLLPATAVSIESELSADVLEALSGSGRLAISLEPQGGSPTGLPTGPVVYQASLISI